MNILQTVQAKDDKEWHIFNISYLAPEETLVKIWPNLISGQIHLMNLSLFTLGRIRLNCLKCHSCYRSRMLLKYTNDLERKTVSYTVLRAMVGEGDYISIIIKCQIGHSFTSVAQL